MRAKPASPCSLNAVGTKARTTRERAWPSTTRKNGSLAFNPRCPRHSKPTTLVCRHLPRVEVLPFATEYPSVVSERSARRRIRTRVAIHVRLGASSNVHGEDRQLNTRILALRDSQLHRGAARQPTAPRHGDVTTVHNLMMEAVPNYHRGGC